MTRQHGFSVTYERYLPNDDDVNVCDADERGFVVRNVSLRAAARDGLESFEPSWCGPCEPDSFPPVHVRWLYFYEWNDCTREMLETGIRETRSLHFPNNLTESSRRRVCRLFGIESPQR